MKKLYLSLLMLVFCAVCLEAQTTITIKPDPVVGKDAFVHGLPSEANNNYGSNDQFCIASWSFSGILGNIRSLVEFPLGQIPANATIISASLSLYAINHNTGFGYHSTLSGSNDSWIERITGAWDESTVTWNNQPQTTTQNRVSMPASTSQQQDFLNIDVTQLVVDMYTNPTMSHGFMIKLKTENYYRRLNFCSSDHPNESKWPELSVTYVLGPVNDTCFTLQPDPVDGKDAFVHGLPSLSTNNWGSNEQLCAAAWTFNGDPGVVRSLIDFDLPVLPANAVVTSAELSLYSIDNENGFGYHSSLSGPNEAWVERITGPWSESTVNWNTQPVTTATNRISLSTSTSPTQNYLDLNVTQLVKDMYQNPANSYGFMIKLQNESYFRRMNFCSSDHPNASKRPKLKVCYSILSSIDPAAEASLSFSVFPNPSGGIITLNLPDYGTNQFNVSIVSMSGQMMYQAGILSGVTTINLSHLATGIYICQVYSSTGEKAIRKLVIQ